MDVEKIRIEWNGEARSWETWRWKEVMRGDGGRRMGMRLTEGWSDGGWKGGQGMEDGRWSDGGYR